MKIRPAYLVLVIGLSVAVGVFMTARLRSAGTPVALLPNDAKVLTLGASVYTARCAACHGLKLEGQPEWRSRGPDGLLPAPPHDESGHTWHHADDLLFRITKFGVGAAINDRDYKSTMPAFEGVLSDEEIIAVLSWIKSHWPPQVRAHNDEINASTKR
jgi:S-disulfanyl-L-cysteine oxidoreductase SoxD